MEDFDISSVISSASDMLGNAGGASANEEEIITPNPTTNEVRDADEVLPTSIALRTDESALVDAKEDASLAKRIAEINEELSEPISEIDDAVKESLFLNESDGDLMYMRSNNRLLRSVLSILVTQFKNRAAVDAIEERSAAQRYAAQQSELAKMEESVRQVKRQQEDSVQYSSEEDDSDESFIKKIIKQNSDKQDGLFGGIMGVLGSVVGLVGTLMSSKSAETSTSTTTEGGSNVEGGTESPLPDNSSAFPSGATASEPLPNTNGGVATSASATEGGSGIPNSALAKPIGEDKSIVPSVVSSNGFNNEHAAEFIANNAAEDYDSTKCGHCAKNVREAIEEGMSNGTGVSTSITAREDAHRYNDILPAIGFKPISDENYTPKVGDVIVEKPWKGHPQGHIQMYVGGEKPWVSDYKQKTGPLGPKSGATYYRWGRTEEEHNKRLSSLMKPTAARGGGQGNELGGGEPLLAHEGALSSFAAAFSGGSSVDAPSYDGSSFVEDDFSEKAMIDGESMNVVPVGQVTNNNFLNRTVTRTRVILYNKSDANSQRE